MSSPDPSLSEPAPGALAKKPAPERENIFLNLAINVILPTVVLTQLSKPERLGPLWALGIGLALPLGYGIWDLAKRRRFNFYSILGIVGVLLTGGLELLKVAPIWFAVKEAAIPLLLGGAVIFSMRTKQPLVKSLLLNPQVLDLEKVDHALAAKGNSAVFEKHLDRGSYWLAGSFLLSAVLNFVLAIWIIKSPAGTPARIEELGKLQGLSYPVIVIPTLAITFFALFQLINGIKKLTGLEMEEIFHAQEEKDPKPTPSKDGEPG